MPQRVFRDVLPNCSASAASPITPGSTTLLDNAVERLLDGDKMAFNEVYRALAPRVFRMLHRLARERATAEDLTQETFERMYRARAGCRRGADITPWAFAIARNLFLDHVRRARHRRLAASQDSTNERLFEDSAP